MISTFSKELTSSQLVSLNLYDFSRLISAQNVGYKEFFLIIKAGLQTSSCMWWSTQCYHSASRGDHLRWHHWWAGHGLMAGSEEFFHILIPLLFCVMNLAGFNYASELFGLEMITGHTQWMCSQDATSMEYVFFCTPAGQHIWRSHRCHISPSIGSFKGAEPLSRLQPANQYAILSIIFSALFCTLISFVWYFFLESIHW